MTRVTKPVATKKSGTARGATKPIAGSKRRWTTQPLPSGWRDRLLQLLRNLYLQEGGKKGTGLTEAEYRHEKAGVAKTTFDKLGKVSEPTSSTFVTIAEKLGYSIDELIRALSPKALGASNECIGLLHPWTRRFHNMNLHVADSLLNLATIRALGGSDVFVLGAMIERLRIADYDGVPVSKVSATLEAPEDVIESLPLKSDLARIREEMVRNKDVTIAQTADGDVREDELAQHKTDLRQKKVHVTSDYVEGPKDSGSKVSLRYRPGNWYLSMAIRAHAEALHRQMAIGNIIFSDIPRRLDVVVTVVTKDQFLLLLFRRKKTGNDRTDMAYEAGTWSVIGEQIDRELDVAPDGSLSIAKTVTRAMCTDHDELRLPGKVLEGASVDVVAVATEWHLLLDNLFVIVHLTYSADECRQMWSLGAEHSDFDWLKLEIEPLIRLICYGKYRKGEGKEWDINPFTQYAILVTLFNAYGREDVDERMQRMVGLRA